MSVSDVMGSWSCETEMVEVSVKVTKISCEEREKESELGKQTSIWGNCVVCNVSNYFFCLLGSTGGPFFLLSRAAIVLQ